MFLVLKKKSIFMALFYVLLVVVSSCLLSTTQVKASADSHNFTVVLDAGHGGIDGGSCGKSGVFERDINLSVTNKIEKFLKTLNINVVQTRRTQDGLYGVFASGFKMRDMKARKQIIEDTNPDLVVSVHMNFFTNSSARGAQVFYKPNSEVSRILANDMQQLFAKHLPNARKTSSEGDFYMLTCTDTPGVLVEGGYLSNPEEESLLITETYQEKLAYQITCGIVRFFDLK